MDKEFDYDRIRSLTAYYLWKQYHERHLEDCIQYVCLKWIEQEGMCNVQWVVIDYCRLNGIGPRGKQTARTLEFATLVGLQSDEESDVKENGFLMDAHASEKFKEEEKKSTPEGVLEEFLYPLGLKQETMIWVLKNYQFKVRIR